jgi:hypothetical protein
MLRVLKWISAAIAIVAVLAGCANMGSSQADARSAIEAGNKRWAQALARGGAALGNGDHSCLRFDPGRDYQSLWANGCAGIFCRVLIIGDAIFRGGMGSKTKVTGFRNLEL